VRTRHHSTGGDQYVSLGVNHHVLRTGVLPSIVESTHEFSYSILRLTLGLPEGARGLLGGA
jgi:hypothetical protein